MCTMVGIPRVYTWWVYTTLVYTWVYMVGIHLPGICPGIPPWVHPASHCRMVYRSSCLVCGTSPADGALGSKKEKPVGRSLPEG